MCHFIILEKKVSIYDVNIKVTQVSIYYQYVLNAIFPLMAENYIPINGRKEFNCGFTQATIKRLTEYHGYTTNSLGFGNGGIQKENSETGNFMIGGGTERSDRKDLFAE